MKHKSLIAYLVIVFLLSGIYVAAMKFAGQAGGYLAQAFMLLPAISALLTRLFFDERKFSDANLRFGRVRHYLLFWLLGVGIALAYYLVFALMGAGHWDLSGQSFLDRLAQQFALSGQSIEDLPPGMTPQTMLALFFVGGLTVFNILPGMINGFGEEFGWRGLMFPRMYVIRPWVAFILGGLVWYAWHVLLVFVVPQTGLPSSLQEKLILFTALAAGSILTSIYLAYIYFKTSSIFVVSLAHITLNNASASLSYIFVIENQYLANLGIVLVMGLVVAGLYAAGQLKVFSRIG